MLFRIAAFFLLLLAGGAPAQTEAPVTPDAPKTSKIICVRGEADTGSHFGSQKVCHTQAEWDMIHEQSARSLQRYETIQNSQQQNGAGR